MTLPNLSALQLVKVWEEAIQRDERDHGGKKVSQKSFLYYNFVQLRDRFGLAHDARALLDSPEVYIKKLKERTDG